MDRRLGGGKSRVARARIRPRLRERSPTPFAYPSSRTEWVGGNPRGFPIEKASVASEWAVPPDNATLGGRVASALAEVGIADAAVGGELRAGARERNPARLQHVAAGGELEGRPGILLDE